MTESEIRECPVCEGDGEFRASECIVCFGHGEVLVVPDENGEGT